MEPTQTISNAFEEISSGYKFEIRPNKSNDLELFFGFRDRQKVWAPNCGLGLQDLLVLLYFAIRPGDETVCIEEPESHLHPDLQRRLLHFLRTETEKQFFITTHSNVFLDATAIDRVLFTTWNGSINVDDATSRALLLNDLGYSVNDNLTSDLVVLVEGPKDAPFLEEMFSKRGLWSSYGIKLWPLGGDIVDQLDLSLLKEHYKIIALLDKDPKSGGVRKKFEEKCIATGIEVHRLHRYSLENYFSIDAVRSVFGTLVPESIVTIAPDTKLEEQLGFSVKKKTREIAKFMSLDDINGTDLSDFFSKVEELCKT